MIKLSRKDISWSKQQCLDIGYIFDYAVAMSYPYFEFDKMLYKINHDKRGYGLICSINEVEFIEDEKIEEVTIGDRVVLLDDFFTCRKVETHELLKVPNFPVIDGFEDRNSVVVNYYSMRCELTPIYSKLIDGYKYVEIRKPKGEKMKVTKLDILCDCGYIIKFYSPDGKHHMSERFCPYCHKTWELKDIRIEEKKVDKLQRVKDKIVKFLRNKGWSDKKIENFLISGEKVIKEVVEYIIKEGK